MSAELKPCPLCGTSARVFRIEDMDDQNFGGIGICCETDGCVQIGLRFACGEDPTPELIEQWNRRALAAPSQPEPAQAAAEGEREAFEAWYANDCNCRRDGYVFRRNAVSGTYQCHPTEDAWLAWQAARRPVRELTDAEVEDVFSRYWHHQWRTSGGARVCQISLAELANGARALLSKATGEGK